MFKKFVLWLAGKYLTPEQLLALGTEGNALTTETSITAIRHLMWRRLVHMNFRSLELFVGEMLDLVAKRTLYKDTGAYLRERVYNISSRHDVLEHAAHRIVQDELERNESPTSMSYPLDVEDFIIFTMQLEEGNVIKRKSLIGAQIALTLPELSYSNKMLLVSLIEELASLNKVMTQ